MLEKVKTALRITNAAYDGEVSDLIEGARLDLYQSGVSLVKTKDDEDPLIKRAIVLYAKAHFGLDSPDAVRFQESYISLKKHLSMAGDYNGRVE